MNTPESSFIRPDEFWHSLGLRANQIVVHLGCGPGFFLIPAAKIVGPGGSAIGVDVRPDMLAETENKARRENVDRIVTTHRANLENEPGSPVADKTGDWVLVANILHQADPARILKEAARVAAANGHVVVVEWDTKATPLGPPAARRLSRQDVETAAVAAGLTIDKQIKPSPYHYGLVASKGS